MKWSDVLADPSLQDLSYKIETNGYGQIVMSPASSRHARLQSRIASLLERCLTEGEVIVECPVQTSSGVKVPDVAWAGVELLERQADADVFSESPEICIEVLSPSNSKAEIDSKRALYLGLGAQEVWVCDVSGALSFYNADGPLDASLMAPGFPDRVNL